MMAVPCWSSCITGILQRFLSSCSIKKHSGAFISSKLIPPNVGSNAATISTNFCGSVSFISISNTSMSAKILNRTALPSITGLLASGPILPRPKTAVPFVITPTKFPFAVYLKTSSGLFTISLQGSATPGEYARERSRWVFASLVGITSILPGLPLEWYSNANCFRSSFAIIMLL